MQRMRIGVSSRGGAVFLFSALALVLLMWQGQARADSLTLDSASPAGTVTLGGTALPAQYNPVNAYAGVLDWTTGTIQGTPNVWTYCIDVAAIISTNTPYSFTSGSLGFNLTNNTTIVNAIERLWQDSTFVNPVTHVSAGAINTQASVNQIGAEYASMFQVALWDIIYNAGSASTSNTALSFSNPGNGLSSTDLSNALIAAHADYQSAVTNGAPTNVPQLTELYASGGQNQVLFLGLAGAPSAPLPNSFLGGLALLGLLGVAALRRNKAHA